MNQLKIPLVSVIIPVYNSAGVIPHCISSLQAQTLTDWECICVNDGSRDNSLEVLESLAKDDMRICVINKENGGVASARNRGMDEANGETAFFMDADDTLNTTCLEELYAYREKTNSNWCACSTIIYLDGTPTTALYSGLTKRVACYTIESANFAKDFKRIETSVVWGKLYDLVWLRKTGVRFNPKTLFAEDSFFIYELLQHATKVAHLGSCKGYNYKVVSDAQNLSKLYQSKAAFYSMALLEHILKAWDCSKPVNKMICKNYMHAIHKHNRQCLKNHKWDEIVFPSRWTWSLWKMATPHYKFSWASLLLLNLFLKQKQSI